MKLATIPNQQCESLCLKELKQGLYKVLVLVNGLLERHSYLLRNIKSVVVDTGEEVTEVIAQLGKAEVAH